MRLTKEDGRILLRAIDVELESQYYRRVSREKYPAALRKKIEPVLRAEDVARAEALRTIRDKIKRQL